MYQTAGTLFLVVYLLVSVNACSTTAEAPVDTRRTTRAAVKPTTSADPEDENNREQHIVLKGDTLYSIAWLYGLDYRHLALWNAISEPYVIYPGQTIRLRPSTAEQKQIRQPGPVTASKNSSRQSAAKSPTAVKKPSTDTVVLKWQWPTTGKLLHLDTPVAKKGIDIAGTPGQKVNAAATGSVVYSGSGLLGYGKLIIVKHSDDYLSAYAHNDKILVKEGDKVNAGQQIATMGQGNSGESRLHFEIRKNGKPVDPLLHLPGNRS